MNCCVRFVNCVRARGPLNKICLIGLFLLATAPVFAAEAIFSQESEVKAYLERGKQFYNQKDFQSAIKTWSKVLDKDPFNEEALDLIDDAKFQADYQIAVLDKLSKEERLKTPYAAELAKMADEMVKLLADAESKMSHGKKAGPSTVTDKEVLRVTQERQANIKQGFLRGLDLFNEGNYESAFQEWNTVLSILPKEHLIVQRIEELKAHVAENSKKIAQETDHLANKAANQEKRLVAELLSSSESKDPARSKKSRTPIFLILAALLGMVLGYLKLRPWFLRLFFKPKRTLRAEADMLDSSMADFQPRRLAKYLILKKEEDILKR